MTIRKVKKLLRAYAQKSLEQYMNDEILVKLLVYQAKMKTQNNKKRG